MNARALLVAARDVDHAITAFRLAAEGDSADAEHASAVDLADHAQHLADLTKGAAMHQLVHAAPANPAIAHHDCTWCATTTPAAIHISGDADDQQHTHVHDDLYVCAACADEALAAVLDQLRDGGQAVITPARH
jgi:hypothetical protein